MMPEPADTGHCMAHGVVVQSPLAQHWTRQGRSRVTILDDEDRQRRVAAIFGEEALVHCDLFWR
eukprot:15479869-Alexandrium_andersonii.AAC.1